MDKYEKLSTIILGKYSDIRKKNINNNKRKHNAKYLKEDKPKKFDLKISKKSNIIASNNICIINIKWLIWKK